MDDEVRCSNSGAEGSVGCLNTWRTVSEVQLLVFTYIAFPRVKPTILSRFSQKRLHKEPEALESLCAFGGERCFLAYIKTAVCNSEQVSGLLRNGCVNSGVCKDKGNDITNCSVMHN